MAIIINPIPTQNFEKIRDRIALILFTEFENQYFLSYDNDLNLPVWVERTLAFDHTEAPAINVSLASGNFDNKDQRAEDGTYLYNIDVYTKAKSIEGADINGGDQRATIKLHRLLGMCRAILEHPDYFRLLFPPPSISNVKVVSLAFADPGKQDAENVMMGRLVFSVRVPETVELKVANLIDGYDTAVKMDLTDSGYVFSGNQPDIPPDTCEPVTININGVLYAIVDPGDTKEINIEYLSGGTVPVSFDYETVIVPDGDLPTWGNLWP